MNNKNQSSPTILTPLAPEKKEEKAQANAGSSVKPCSLTSQDGMGSPFLAAAPPTGPRQAVRFPPPPPLSQAAEASPPLHTLPSIT